MALVKKMSYIWMLGLFLLLLDVIPISMIFVAEDTFKSTTVLPKGKKPASPKRTTFMSVKFVPPDTFETTTVLPKGKKPTQPITRIETTPPHRIEPAIAFTGFVTTAPTAEPTTILSNPTTRIEPAIPFKSPVITAPSTEPTTILSNPTTRIEPAIPFASPVITAPSADPTTMLSNPTSVPSPEPMIAELIAQTTMEQSPEPMIAELIAQTTMEQSPEPMIAELIPQTTMEQSPEPMIAELIPQTTTEQSPEPMIAELIPPTSMEQVSAGGITAEDFTELMELNTSTSDIISSLISTTSTESPGLQHHQLGALLETVLSDYNPRLRPRNDQSRFVAIFSDFVPVSIIEFNTQEQKFSVMGYFKMDWRDDFLTWKPSMYEAMKYVRIPTQSIWIPKLSIDKAYDGKGLVGDMYSDIALINYRGYVRWFPEGTYSVVCRVTIRFYPFDIQTCTLSYFIADEDNNTINFKHDGEVDLSEYIENAEWKLIELTAERKLVNNVYVVNFHFNVERRGGFAMFTLVVPVLLLAMLSGATFLIPIESGEKCSFSVTIFLAYGIFETVVIDTLPPNSLDISYFIIYLTSLLTISVLLTFYTILQAKIVETMGDKVFKCLSGTNSGSLTWGLFLQKLDTYVFVLFLVLVVGFTSIFFAVMSEKFDIM